MKDFLTALFYLIAAVIFGTVSWLIWLRHPSAQTTQRPIAAYSAPANTAPALKPQLPTALDVSGRWSYRWSVSAKSGLLEIEDNNGVISGTETDGVGHQYPIIGTFSNNQIKFTNNVINAGGVLEFQYIGTVTSDTISGTVRTFWHPAQSPPRTSPPDEDGWLWTAQKL